MASEILVATRKGLFRVVRGRAGWAIEDVSFLGHLVSMVLPDARDGARYAALGLGHYGVKMRKSRDGGRTWGELPAPSFPKQPEGETDTLPDGKPWPWRVEQVWSLEPGHAGEPGVLWCGTIPGGLFRSSDGGASWELVRSLWDMPERKAWFGGGADLPGIHSICVHRDALTVGVSSGGVWRSTDGGASWRVASHGMYADYMPPERRDDPLIQDPHRLAQCAGRPDVIWAQHHNGVFRSTDGAASWRDLCVEPSVFGFAVAVHPRDGDVAWLVPAVKDDARVPVDAKVVVSRTRDGGRTWEVLRRGLPQAHAYDIVYRHALDVDETGDRLAFGSTTGSLWISEDQGDAWTSLHHLPPIYAVRFVNEPARSAS
jgi:hypothetical protein